MEMSEQRSIPAPRQQVWEALNDPDILKQAMPGCQEFEPVGDDEYAAVIVTRVGPVKAKFKFKITLSEISPPVSYTLKGEGQGGAAGFAKGSAAVELQESGDETLLNYTVAARVGGKLAQLGARLIDGTAKKLADKFFDNFIAIVSGEPAPDSEESQG